MSLDANLDAEPADCPCRYCTAVRQEVQELEAERDEAARLLREDPEYLEWCAEVAQAEAQEARRR